jgi:phage shock protein A
MKTITYGLLIKKADRTFIHTFHKIWRVSVESVPQVESEVAQESLPSIEQSAVQIAASYQCAKDRYKSKQQEFQQAEQQAIVAYQSGNTEAGNLAMGKAIAIKLILSELADQVRQAEHLKTIKS